MALGTFTMTGKTGNDFEFVAYPWDEDIKPIGAVYVITKCTPEPGGHLHYSPIYVGQTHDLSTHFDNHDKTDCLARYGANCVCVLAVNDARLRAEVVSEIRKQYNLICND
jgi:hypothetical protein